MTTTHILGDNVPRKSNFDPLLAEKLTRYYAEHPEELEKPVVLPASTDTIKQPAGKYILMPQTATYALGIHALQEQCIKENNQNHPKFNFTDGSFLYRPLSFKENIQAHVENYETMHNPDGGERTIEERLSLIMEQENDSCTAMVYKAGTTKFKIVPISPQLITLNSDFKREFLRIDYNTIFGTELDSSKGIYNTLMSQDLVLKHAGWLAAVEGDGALLKSYTHMIFKELKRQYDRTEGMGFWVLQNTPTDELRALYVGDFNSGSDADGSNDLNNYNSLLRVTHR